MLAPTHKKCRKNLEPERQSRFPRFGFGPRLKPTIDSSPQEMGITHKA